jgi:hypothetical protein
MHWAGIVPYKPVAEREQSDKLPYFGFRGRDNRVASRCCRDLFAQSSLTRHSYQYAFSLVILHQISDKLYEV